MPKKKPNDLVDRILSLCDTLDELFKDRAESADIPYHTTELIDRLERELKGDVS